MHVDLRPNVRIHGREAHEEASDSAHCIGAPGDVAARRTSLESRRRSVEIVDLRRDFAEMHSETTPKTVRPSRAGICSDLGMRLIAIEIPPAVTSGEPGFLKLAAVAAVLGANDAGKSRMLRAIAQALDFRNPHLSDLGHRPRFFVEVDNSPGRWLDEERDHASRHEVPFVEDRRFLGRALEGDKFRPEMRVLLDAQALGMTDPADHRLLLLREWAGLSHEEWDPVIDELRQSHLAVIRPVADGWVFEWCLPHWDDLEPPARECLMRLGLEPERPDQPIVATPLLPWVVGFKGLPRVRVVPRGDPMSEYGDFNIRSELEASPDPVDNQLWSAMVQGLFERLTVSRLPPFITSQYDVSTDRRGLTWFVRRRCGTRLAPADVADGFRVWVEIALIDASETIDDVVVQLAAILNHEADWPNEDGAAPMLLHLHRHRNDFVSALTTDPMATVDLLASTAPLIARDRHSREAYSYVGSAADTPLTITAGTGEQSGSLFLIDEPERHLHPRLQRQAAAWLQRVADEDLLNGQILLATHSISLMGLARGVQYNEVRRPGASTIVVPVGPRQLDLLDTLSNELGLTRGELITMRRVFLFVEGAVDKLVFQELFGDRLRDAGIEVLAMHGTTKMQAIIESDLLFDSYRQRIAVVVDNIVANELPRPDDIDELARLCGTRGASNQELRKAAELLKNAHYAGRCVALEAIPTPDVIAELDAEVIRDVQDTDYPGYEISRAEWRATEPSRSWKRFCTARNWFRASPDDIRPVAVEMRRRGIKPPELARLVTWVERLAVEADE